MATANQNPNPNPPSQTQCPEGCCQGNEILCISTPCPIQIVLLGIPLELNISCLSLGSSNTLTGAQIGQILGVLQSLLGGIGGAIPGAGGTTA